MHFLLDALTQISPYSISDMANILTQKRNDSKRFNLQLDFELWRAVKMGAMDRGITMTRFIKITLAKAMGIEPPAADEIEEEEEG